MNVTEPGSGRRRLAALGLAAWSLAVAVCLAVLAPNMAPVRHGTGADFWEVACGIEFEPPAVRSYGTAFIDPEGWYVYDRGHLHGSDAYYVSAGEAAARLDDAIKEIEGMRNAGGRTLAPRAYAAWIDAEANGPRDPATFVRHLNVMWEQAFLEDGPRSWAAHLRDRESLAERWGRMKTSWATLAFEWLLFTALAAIALRPPARGLGPFGWGLHFAILPPLFMLPAYLGYSTFTFTSAGPSGGVLYPWVQAYGTIGLCRAVGARSMSEVDRELLERLPQLLDPISAPIGVPVALSGLGMPGPTGVIVFGLFLGVAVGGCRWTLQRRRTGPLVAPPRTRLDPPASRDIKSAP